MTATNDVMLNAVDIAVTMQRTLTYVQRVALSTLSFVAGLVQLLQTVVQLSVSCVVSGSNAAQIAHTWRSLVRQTPGLTDQD